MTTDITRPLDREEMANYMTYLNDSNASNTQAMITFIKEYIDHKDKEYNAFLEGIIDVLSKKLVALTNIIEASNKKTAKIQEEFLSTITTILKENKSENIIIKRNPLFHNTMSASDQELWIEKVCGEIAKICLEEHLNKDVVYNDIYAALTNKGYNLETLLKEYKQINPNANLLTMIAASGELCSKFSNEINKRIHKEIVSTLKNTNVTTIKPTVKSDKKLSYSSEVKRCPDNVRNIIKRLSNGKNPAPRTYKKAYDLIGIDTDAIVKTTAKRLNVSDVSVAYAIGTNPILVSQLDRAVTEYLNKKGGAVR